VATTAGVESESILSGVLSKFVTCEPSSVPSISKRMALAMVEAVVTGTVMSAIKRMIRILLHSRDPAEEESLSLDLPKSNALQTGQQEGLTEGSVKMSKKGTRAELETVRRPFEKHRLAHSRFISWPTTRQRNDIKFSVMEEFGIPHCIGIIEGFHISSGERGW